MSDAEEMSRTDWRSLAEKASREKDPSKLMTIITELCAALEAEERAKHRKPAVSGSRE